MYAARKPRSKSAKSSVRSGLSASMSGYFGRITLRGSLPQFLSPLHSRVVDSLVNAQNSKSQEKQKQPVQTPDSIICSASVCDELDYFATMGRTDTRGLPQYVAAHTWMWSLKGRLTAEACWTSGAAESAAQSDELHTVREGPERSERAATA